MTNQEIKTNVLAILNKIEYRFDTPEYQGSQNAWLTSPQLEEDNEVLLIDVTVEAEIKFIDYSEYNAINYFIKEINVYDNDSNKINIDEIIQDDEMINELFKVEA